MLQLIESPLPDKTADNRVLLEGMIDVSMACDRFSAQLALEVSCRKTERVTNSPTISCTTEHNIRDISLN